ncbi:hypothetical protein [Bacillus sp. UNC41MFS5]|uniref:hypothetical protein n=1 Tax=Bacillus sp. UNC41MFS5 TaxID=1449046 RepID=UPI00047A4C2F|nr:hypothetical protein [Bacillus sp. UNC41MFS5]
MNSKYSFAKIFEISLLIVGLIGLLLAILSPITFYNLKEKANLEVEETRPVGEVSKETKPVVEVSKETNEIGEFLNNLEDLGPVGDFIGGSSVAFLTFSSVIFLLLTIYLQRQELTETRKESSRANEQYKLSNETMQLQKFETTFYNLIDLLNTNKENIVFFNKNKNEKYLGIDALNEYLKEIRKRRVPIIWSIAIQNYIEGKIVTKDKVELEESLERLEEFISYFRKTNETARKFEMMSIDDRISKLENSEIYINDISVDEVTNIINGYNGEKKGLVKFLQDKIDENRKMQKEIQRQQIKKINEGNNNPLDSYITTLKIILKHVDEFDESQNKDLYYNVILSCISEMERQVLNCFIEYGNYEEKLEFFRLK